MTRMFMASKKNILTQSHDKTVKRTRVMYVPKHKQRTCYRFYWKDHYQNNRQKEIIDAHN